ncbi:Mini-circle protein [Streptomyces sp. NRRL F-4489]|uniref:DinB family protein n=1 Tax=Streptomyces sp. NRRL F-4489 TaxID=1609095 RepID=UPI00074620D6|nr:DinB family protein [Streptomyces sp. NRRL F-4489]KUL38166.1 Mini-circle protein [Streptomyces sp. NRRL F-4489]
MTWTAPPVERRERPTAADERAMLQGWLDHHRDTLLAKCAGLTAEQLLRAATPPSGLTLLGLVRHLADVERYWFRMRFTGEDVGDLYFTEEDPDADFHGGSPATAAADFAALRAEIAAGDAAAAGRGLDETFTVPDGRILNLRWIYVHMIEEYARHNGHADLLREAIDGATGS